MEIRFSFRLSDHIRFRPVTRIRWNAQLFRPPADLSAGSLGLLVFQIGMMELISYWKAACSPQVQIVPLKLSPGQLMFWKKLYFNGLGEFFYTNSISADMHHFMEILNTGESLPDPFRFPISGQPVVPVGGGKDSAVTLGLMNNAQIDWIPLVINPREATRQVIRAAGKSESETVIIEREIDPALLKLNDEGFLNGHTPFSATLAFYSLLTAYLLGRSDIVLSNESSACEPTIPGTSINHQYSKSLEFEADFRNYCGSFISPDFNYFSLLRPLSEIQIARIFSKMPQFFPHFKSCNAGSKTDSWCCSCPKCLFTYIILSPFLGSGILSGIFGKNLLDDPSLAPVLDELTGRAENKPFECTGTIDEVNQALTSTLAMLRGKELPYLLDYYRNGPGYQAGPSVAPGFHAGSGLHHFVPEKYLNLFPLMPDDRAAERT